MPATTVRLRGIECRCNVGVPDKERAVRQRIVLDLDLFPPAFRGRRYVDYFEVYREAKAVAEGRPFRLLEEMAETVARTAISNHPALQRIRVAVRKWPKVMPGVEVVAELERSR